VAKQALALLLVVVASRLTSEASAEPGRYAVELGTSRVTIHVGKTGLFGFAGHEHEVVAPLQQGRIRVDRDHLESASVELIFEAAALRVTGREEPAADVPKVQAAMVGPDCLDAGRFPTIRFVSKAVKVTGNGSNGVDVVIRGEVNIHGVSREISVPAHVVFTQGAIRVNGTAKLQQTAFGIHPITVGGVVKVKDELDLDWHVEARATP
jgi:polyisoprenoid-binding protein YceI